jgi:gluconate kinase
MDPTLLASQLDTLERLAPDEPGIVVGLETTPDEIAITALGRLGLLPA